MLKLKELRNSPDNPIGKKISQKKMAEILQVSRSTIAMWETGASDPDTDSLQKIANYFGVSIDYLLGRYESLGDTNSNGVSEYGTFNISEDEFSFIKRLRRLDTKDRGYIEGQLSAFLQGEKYK